jgi:hypothetical protein
LPRLSAAEREAMRAISARVVGQLLDAPLSVLHADARRGELAMALRRLFLLERPPHARAYRDEGPDLAPALDRSRKPVGEPAPLDS